MGEESWFARHRRRGEVVAYARALAQWELECERLDQAIDSATPDTVPLVSQVGTRLRPGEFLQCELFNVHLVETRQLPGETVSHQANIGFNAPISVGFGTGRTVPARSVDESVVVDSGSVAITDQRVTFAGRKFAREWPLADLIRPVYDRSACTIYLPLSSRDVTSGFRYDAQLDWLATSQLEVALARYSDDWQVVEAWERRRDELERLRPTPPPQLETSSYALERAREELRRREESARASSAHATPSSHVGRRLVARLIDLVLGSLVMSFFSLLAGAEGSSATLAGWVGGITVYELLPVWWFGASLGKRLTALTVIDVDTGDAPSLGRAFLRTAALTGVAFTIVAPLIITCRLALRVDGRAWHDRLAGTTVVRASR